MFRKILVAGLAVLAVVALGSAAPQKAEPKGAVEEADFAGKVIAVGVPDPVKGGIIRNARLKRLGGRLFLTGDALQPGLDDETPDMVYWFPVEDIKLIREYKSLDDLKKNYAAERAFERAGKDGQ